MNTKQKIEVMQAWVDGKSVEWRDRQGKWIPMPISSNDPTWNWQDYDYRVKPKPMEIEVWVNNDGKPAALEPWIIPAQACGPWTKKKFREVLDE